MGLGGPRERGRAVEERLELDLAEFERLGRARHDDLVHLVVRFGQRAFQRRLQGAAHECGLGA